MSTIVYRDGVMASDSRAYSGNSAPIGSKMKIRRLKDGSLVGISTCRPGLSERMMAWFDEGNPNDKAPTDLDFVALVVRPNGEVFFYHDSIWPSGPLCAPWFAIGSGEEYAMGALAMGASAFRAVEVAAALDTMSAPPVTVLELHPRDVEPGPVSEEALADA